MRIDAHQHFWAYTRQEYPWIGPGMEALAKDRLPSDLLPLIEANGFDGTVAVQARQCLEETSALLKMAGEAPFIKGVVGWVDLQSDKVEEQLERFSDNPLLVGVRHVVQDEPDDNFVLRSEFLNGIGSLSGRNLAYDILVFPHQLPATIEMVSKFPEQVFVLDHMGKPLIKEGRLSPWQSDIRRLASFENVSCKISGMVTEADWQTWEPADFDVYMEVVLEAFGPRRLMLGSDWPVCTLAGQYGSVMDISVNFIKQLSEEEQVDILEKNPVSIYGLAPDPDERGT